MSNTLGWTILDKYFEENTYFATKHHIESYNYFITQYIPFCIKSLNSSFEVLMNNNKKKDCHNYRLKVFVGGENGDQLTFSKPVIIENNETRLLYPNEARLKNISYVSQLHATILFKYYNKDDIHIANIDKTLKDVILANIPIMLHSSLCVLNSLPPNIRQEMGECPYDQGGYFIVNGKEKVIVSQERDVTNKLFVLEAPNAQPEFSHVAYIRCQSEKNSVFPKTIYFHVLSRKTEQGRRENAIVVTIPDISFKIPLFLLFRVLGIESDKAIIDLILGEAISEPDEVEQSIKEKMLNFLSGSIVDGNIFYSQADTFQFLKTFVKYNQENTVKYLLMMNLFPNVPETFDEKAKYLALLVRDILKVCIGLSPVTDRDNYMYKRVGISGFLMADIFKNFYNAFRNKVRSFLDNEYKFGPYTTEESLKNQENIGTLINESNKHNIAADELLYGLIKSLKGNWGLDSKGEGIVQDLNRISYIGFMSHLRRVTSTLDPAIKIRTPHQLHSSQWGVVCPCESPDGASIGLLKNFSMLCHISFSIDSDIIKSAINVAINAVDKPFTLTRVENLPTISITDPYLAVLKINNNVFGILSHPHKFVRYMRLLRRTGCINHLISIVWNVFDQEINVFTEGGRCLRPLFIVEDLKPIHVLTDKKESKFPDVKVPKLAIRNIFSDDILPKKTTWKSLIIGSLNKKFTNDFVDPFQKLQLTSFDDVCKQLEKQMGVIEFLDVEESNRSRIAMYETDLNDIDPYTHCEIHPSTIMSVYTGTIPLAHHNQAPRNVFSGAQGKQSIGCYASNFNNRIDTMAYVLHYPQKPLVSTKYYEYINNDKLPNGENLIVAVCCYSGYNQEDSMILNQRAVDRGMFNLTYYHAHVSEETVEETVDKKSQTKTAKNTVRFANPYNLQDDLSVKLKPGNYQTIDENGMPKINSYIEEGDCIIGKVISKIEYDHGDENDRMNLFKESIKTESFESHSDIADKVTSGFIDKVVVFENEEGVRTAKIRMRKWMIPELGDKLGSRHAQKGTIGRIMRHEDMPYTNDGIVPDVIINPHCLPSRMTIAHVLENVIAKAACLEGFEYDGTAFENHDFESIYDILEKKNFHRHGDEIMYNGITGEQMNTEIFINPIFFYRMKHMVSHKINARGKGKMMKLTRQPPKGRGNSGGLSVGSMEQCAIHAWGISSFLKETFYDRSDKYTTSIDKSGQIIPVNYEQGIFPGNDKFYNIEFPYAFKLFMQEMQTMSILPRLRFEDISEDKEELDNNSDIDLSDNDEDDAENEIILK